MKGRLWTYAKPIVVLVIVAYLFYFILDRRALLSSFFGHNPSMIIAVTGGVLLQILLQAGLLKVLVRPLGVDLPVSKTLAIGFLAGTAGTLLPFQAGIGVKGVYLKRVHDLSYTSLVASALVNKLTKLITCVAIAVLTLLFVGTTPHAGLVMLLLIPVFVAPLALFLLARFPSDRIPSRRLREILDEFGQAWRLMRNDRPTLIAIFLIQFSIMAVNGAVFYILFLSLGETLPFSLLTAYIALKFLAGMVAVLPANIGVSEAITGILSDLADMPFEVGVMAALIVRLISTLILLAGSVMATLSRVLDK